MSRTYRATRMTPRLRPREVQWDRRKPERELKPPNLSDTWYGTLGEWALKRELDNNNQKYTFTPNQVPKEELGGVRASFILQDRVINISDQLYNPFEKAQIEGRGLAVVQLTEAMAQQLVSGG